MKALKLEKKWIIAIISAIIVCVVGIFIYERNANRVFTRPEYVKEVIVQNQNFDDLLDNFLDLVTTYSATTENTEKLENSAKRLVEFVGALKQKLGPKVPAVSKSHYEAMIAAYDIYLEAISLYKKAVPKNLGEERSSQISEARGKLEQAQTAMKNLG